MRVYESRLHEFCAVVTPDKRIMPSPKHTAHLPLIAPKDDAVVRSSESGAKSGTADEQKLKMPVRVRLPPRSRTGCW